MNKIMYNNEYLQSYCKENNIILTNSYNNTNRDTRIIGKCLTENCQHNFNKVFRQLVKSGSYCNICSKIKHQNKIKEAVLDKYGVENVFQMKEIKDKIQNTNLVKYGVLNPNQNQEVRSKTRKTCIEKYGVEYPSKSNNVKLKIEKTCIEKYGVNNPLKSNIVRDKAKQYYLKNYGVEYPHQVPEIAEKAHKNSYRKKIYILPSGKEIICQGYEPFALEKLVKEENVSEEDIVTGCKNVPQIWYNDYHDKKHRHYVDIYIPSQNRCIEVKSVWTSRKDKKDNIYLKQNAAKELGYQYEIWIFNAKKELLEVKT
jgi:hypothetical protein